MAFKSAEKTLPGWKMVPPRYTRPVAGTVLLVHSGPATVCDDANRHAPLPRLIAQPTPGSAYATCLSPAQCLAAMGPARRAGGDGAPRDRVARPAQQKRRRA